MSKFDLNSIDDFRGLLNKNEPYKSDFNLINPVVNFIKRNDKTFTYIVKHGNHFPWGSNNYDDKYAVYPSSDNLHLNYDNKDKLIDNYDNGIYYSVDMFLSKLIPSVKSLNATVIYTSDHGQNVLDNTDVITTHCSASGEIPIQQGEVPLFVFNDDNVIKSDNNGYYSHFNIISSILYNMGYNVDKDETFYSKTPRKYNYFYAGNIWSSNIRKININI